MNPYSLSAYIGQRNDPQLFWAFGGVLAVLALASIVGYVLKAAVKNPAARDTIDNLNTRIRAWWVMCVVFALTLLVGRIGSLVLFGAMSYLAFNEYLKLVPASRADRTAFWTFLIFTPLQYYLIAINDYGLFAILIPVYAFLFLPTRMAIVGNTEAFLERASTVQWGLMVCVYCLSYAPAILTLHLRNYSQNAKLLLFLVLVDQLADVLQYVFGKLFGRHKIAPRVSPNKTWEGFVGGVVTATAIGAALWWMTPFSPPAAAAISLAITLMGFAGGLTMSAIKRDRGVKDYGELISGHGGILDRVDSLCFAAPIFFHIVRFFYRIQ